MKAVPKTVVITNPNFRPGTQTEFKEVIFNMIMDQNKSAALGDMIAWMPAIKYVAREYNYVQGILIVPPYFLDLARALMAEHPHWRIFTKIPSWVPNGTQMQIPAVNPINATGMHLTDLGFLYFCGMVPPPADARNYPLLDLEDVKLPEKLESIGPYVVMTPGAGAQTRAMLPSVFNAITKHLSSKGIVPVFLGTRDMVDRPELQFDARYDMSLGIDMIGQTSLLEAAKVIEGSKMILGIDNGLLHLAGLTDATILYGFTVAGPEQRRLPRSHGHTIELFADKEKLPCLFCQERVRFFQAHHFTNCIYKENEPACVKALNAESWIATIDVVLGEQ